MVKASTVMRVAQPTDDLARIIKRYRPGLRLSILAIFKDHEVFDGVILYQPHSLYHLKFTHHQGPTASCSPAADNLLILYLHKATDWKEDCAELDRACFLLAASFNPFYDICGKTFEDADGYRVAPQNRCWAS